MKTAILILNWNGGEDTVNCLQSVMPGMEANDYLFVIDNGSVDDSVKTITTYLDSVQKSAVLSSPEDLGRVFKPSQNVYVVRNAVNSGFGGGNNAVLTRLDTLSEEFEYAWLLNNDALAGKAAFTSLKNSLSKNKKVAVAGSVILNYPGEATIQCTGVKYYRLLGVSKLINKNQPAATLSSAPVAFDYLNGASLMFRLTPLKTTGYFDERFFLYSEEFDLQLRLQKLNHELFLDKESIVYHKLSGGTRNQRHLFYYHYNKSATLLSRKHFPLLVNLCAVINLLAITLVRTFPDFKNFIYGLKGIVKGFQN